MTERYYPFAEHLEQLERQGLYRRRRVVEGAQGVRLCVDGKAVVNFCSNDYLGLANHPELVAAFRQAVDRFGVGSGSAHLICGHSRAHHALEEELAEFTGRERALLFSNGYMANLGLISALIGRNETVLEDRLNHASLLDGGLLARAEFKRYQHRDCADLRARLAKCKGRALIVSDGVFSMDGDLADLPGLVALASEFNAGLMIDDAHGFGVLGGRGGGIAEHFGFGPNEVPILMGTLGKAFGTFGAFVAGSDDLIEFLIQKARTYVFTTALPPAVAEATRTGLRLMRNDNWRRDKLNNLITHFRQGAAQQGLRLIDSVTAIQPILIGDSRHASAISAALFERGFWVGAIRPPTVPAGTARLRVTLSAAHEINQVDALLDALGQVAA